MVFSPGVMCSHVTANSSQSKEGIEFIEIVPTPTLLKNIYTASLPKRLKNNYQQIAAFFKHFDEIRGKYYFKKC